MDQNDRYAIEGLFGKLAEVERQAPQRDAQADAFIRERMSSQPGAPYFMAQTIVVQEQALEAAQQRIEELEYQLASRPAQGGGFFSSLFGSSQPQRSMPPRQPSPMMGQAYGQQPQSGAQAGPWGQQSAHGRPAGGGFLAGAAQTAMGVAGGMLLGNAIAGMLGGDEAQAAENDSSSQDDGGGDDGGDDSFF
ncbi:DUF2076 domain-containing protein [Rhizobium sp. G21]|uniref:DUF2076 domain-containing protein n=1 Tax=Rhizobium sp. G21 TaxID=2758439 RepID=UPI0016035F1F|nr:DUF2076 domain-containing protein [Rhizobium sp. G21]MBB1248170.1 DUF2076 domain-containing protein [Rhizobium sp. G21]